MGLAFRKPWPQGPLVPMALDLNRQVRFCMTMFGDEAVRRS